MTDAARSSGRPLPAPERTRTPGSRPGTRGSRPTTRSWPAARGRARSWTSSQSATIITKPATTASTMQRPGERAARADPSRTGAPPPGGFRPPPCRPAAREPRSPRAVEQVGQARRPPGRLTRDRPAPPPASSPADPRRWTQLRSRSARDASPPASALDHWNRLAETDRDLLRATTASSCRPRRTAPPAPPTRAANTVAPVLQRQHLGLAEARACPQAAMAGPAPGVEHALHGLDR